ncbi:hypothetical protein B0H14DRAFT_2609633 [Mycena olivaceomarginata]|nr:hypothetical protein B0H14DRAFT_2609633 [Mycena olivaceomarginata]
MSNSTTQRGSGRLVKDDENVMFWYIQDKDGKTVSGKRVKAMRAHARHIWSHLLSISKLPDKWSNATSVVRNYYAGEMRRQFPELQLCDLDYKSHRIATEIFPGWRTTYITNKAPIKLESDIDDDLDDNVTEANNNDHGLVVGNKSTRTSSEEEQISGQAENAEPEASHDPRSEAHGFLGLYGWSLVGCANTPHRGSSAAIVSFIYIFLGLSTLFSHHFLPRDHPAILTSGAEIMASEHNCFNTEVYEGRYEGRWPCEDGSGIGAEISAVFHEHLDTPFTLHLALNNAPPDVMSRRRVKKYSGQFIDLMCVGGAFIQFTMSNSAIHPQKSAHIGFRIGFCRIMLFNQRCNVTSPLTTAFSAFRQTTSNAPVRMATVLCSGQYRSTHPFRRPVVARDAVRGVRGGSLWCISTIIKNYPAVPGSTTYGWGGYYCRVLSGYPG